jgi:beta-phosphoglucomutase-like phosphatase (HAD superfamily)
MHFEAVLFDCDGVLVDSEPITIGVLRDMLEELGWKLSTQECMALFVGCASGADRFKVELQLRKVGLLNYFEGRIFSGQELARSKPAPDVYLAAARALSVDPTRCAVVEDTLTGVTAGVAAGAMVFGNIPPEAGHDAPEALRRAGAVHILTDMAQLPAMLDAWRA